MEAAAVLAAAVAFVVRGLTISATPSGVDDGTVRYAVARANALQFRYGHGIGCRHLFFVDFSAATHLNHGSYGTAPRSVVRAAAHEMEKIEAWPDDFMRRRGLREVSIAADQAGAQYFSSAAGSTVFVENATVGVNAVLRSVSAMIPKGKAVLIFDRALRPSARFAKPSLRLFCALHALLSLTTAPPPDTYNACKNATYDMAEKANLRTVTCLFPLPLPRGGASGEGSCADGLCELLDAALTAEGDAVGLVLLDHITSPTGIVMPVARLAAVAHAHGALVLCDGAHAPGQIANLNPSALGVDWYVGNLHKWAFTLKGVAILWCSDAVRNDTQGSIISHNWKLDYQARHFMQGTLDYSRYLSAAAGAAFVAAQLGGFSAMQVANTALVQAGARILEEAWWGKALPGAPPRDLRLLSPAAIAEGLTAPFLQVVRTPLDWRAWVRGADGRDVRSLDDAAARAALLADGGLSDRFGNAVLAQPGRVQSVFFPWEYGGDIVIWCRISAQVYNTVAEYETLAAAVSVIKLTEGLA